MLYARGLVGIYPHYRRWGLSPRPEDSYLLPFYYIPDITFCQYDANIFLCKANMLDAS